MPGEVARLLDLLPFPLLFPSLFARKPMVRTLAPTGSTVAYSTNLSALDRFDMNNY